MPPDYLNTISEDDYHSRKPTKNELLEDFEDDND